MRSSSRASGADAHESAGETAAHPGRRTLMGSVATATAGGGRPLEGAARSGLERGFGAPLGEVRVHDGPAAAASAAELGAHAYAVGQDIVFGAGEYQPTTPQGNFMLAHEVAHTIQQGDAGGALQRKALDRSAPGDAHEVEADQAAQRVLGGEQGVAGDLSRGGVKLMPFTTKVPWQQSSRWKSAPMHKHTVNLNAFGMLLPKSGAAVMVALISGPSGSLDVPAGSEGTIRLWGAGDYGINNGTFMDPLGDMGDFHWTTEWAYRCSAEGVLTVNPTPRQHTPHHAPGITHVIRSPIAMGWGANTDGSTEVAELLTFNTGGGSNPSVGYAGIGVNIPLAPATMESFQILPRLALRVTGARAPAPPPQPRADAHAEAHVSLPMPKPVVVPPPFSITFANEAQIEGDAGPLVRWAAALPAEAQDAIRDGRLVVTAIGHASTTGAAKKNFEHYSRRRAEWVRSVMEPALGMAAGSLKIGWRGEYTANDADGVANQAERRVDITFAESHPTTPTSVRVGADAHAGGR